MLKDLKDKGLKKLKEQNIPDKLKTLKDKGLEKLEEQNFQEKFKNLKDKGLEVAKDTYNKNKSDDAGWRKFLSAHPKVKYALYAVLGLFVLGWIFDSEVDTADTGNNEVQQQNIAVAQQNKTHESDNSKKEERLQNQIEKTTATGYTIDESEGKECLLAIARQEGNTVAPTGEYFMVEMNSSVEKDNNCNIEEYTFYYSRVFVGEYAIEKRYVCVRHNSSGNFGAVPLEDFDNAVSSFSQSMGDFGNTCLAYRATAGAMMID